MMWDKYNDVKYFTGGNVDCNYVATRVYGVRTQKRKPRKTMRERLAPVTDGTL